MNGGTSTTTSRRWPRIFATRVFTLWRSICLTARSPRIPRRPAQTKAVQAAEANTTITSWVNWAKANGNGKVATLGWCFGGGWSLSAALANPLDAAVIYYGQVTASAKSLATLSVPLLGHFGTMDKSINPEMVGASQKRLSEAGKANMLTTIGTRLDMHLPTRPAAARRRRCGLGMGAHPYIFGGPSALGGTTTTGMAFPIKGGSRQSVAPLTLMSLSTG